MSQTPVSSIIFRDRGRFLKQLMILGFFSYQLVFLREKNSQSKNCPNVWVAVNKRGVTDTSKFNYFP